MGKHDKIINEEYSSDKNAPVDEIYNRARETTAATDSELRADGYVPFATMGVRLYRRTKEDGTSDSRIVMEMGATREDLFGMTRELLPNIIRLSTMQADGDGHIFNWAGATRMAVLMSEMIGSHIPGLKRTADRTTQDEYAPAFTIIHKIVMSGTAEMMIALQKGAMDTRANSQGSETVN